jgi:hypothetical protein
MLARTILKVSLALKITESTIPREENVAHPPSLHITRPPIILLLLALGMVQVIALTLLHPVLPQATKHLPLTLHNLMLIHISPIWRCFMMTTQIQNYSIKLLKGFITLSNSNSFTVRNKITLPSHLGLPPLADTQTTDDRMGPNPLLVLSLPMRMHHQGDTTPTNIDLSKSMELNPCTMHQPVDMPTTRNTDLRAQLVDLPNLILLRLPMPMMISPWHKLHNNNNNIILYPLAATMHPLEAFRAEVEMMISIRPIWPLMNKLMVGLTMDRWIATRLDRQLLYRR